MLVNVTGNTAEERSENKMKFRHEMKHLINPFDMICLRSRLKAVMSLDANAKEGRYEIRSLYFDDYEDTALREKIDGVNRREKFRIRYYNSRPDPIYLEKKSKINGLCNKQKCPITPKEAEALLKGDYALLAGSQRPLLNELCEKMQIKQLRPKTIVDYTREPFVYSPGNVRVTLDYNIRTSVNCLDFLDGDCLSIPAVENVIILEVKWDEYLPAVIRDIVQTPSSRTAAFSKYELCRRYG